jgi:prolyl oligopeptidase
MRFLLGLSLSLCVALPVHADWKYPVPKTVDAADTYFGKTYRDPYRWLENLKDEEVEAWFKAQADLSSSLLDKIPARDALAKEWLELDRLRPAKYTGFMLEGGRMFYKKTLGSENVGKLYYREGWSGEEKLLFDPTSYKAGVTTVVQSFMPAMDGKHVVLGLTANGAEWSELKVLDVDKGTLLPDTIYPSWGAMTWAADNQSFIYDAGKTTDTKSMEIEQNRKAKLHRLGAKVETDRDLLSNESTPELGIAAKEMPSVGIDETNPDYLVGSVGTVQQEMRVYYAPIGDLQKSKVKWTSICQTSDNLVRGLALHKDSVFAVTHAGAPRYKLVRTSLRAPDWAHAETVVPEAKDSIQYTVRSQNFLFLVYSNGIVGRIVKYALATGKATDVKLPTSGTVEMMCPDPHSNRCIVFATSWITPTTLYDYDADKETVTKSVFNADVVYPGFDKLVVEEVEVPSYDGTLVPLSIIHKKGMKLDGSASAILEGYGAYGISYTPYFNIRHSVATRGVVLAYAHVRGGGEKGEAWYKAGYKTTKPNTWLDFIATAEYLVKKGYTSASRLAGTGTSAGGVLISRAITERPDLFGAAVCNVGCANTMRVEFSPNGPVNIPEFGTVKDEAECRALYEMDGLMHVQPGVRYPAVMGVAGWNDPRVVPWQPGKLAAALQKASTSDKPVLLKVNYDNGHFTEDKLVTFKNFADQVAFMLWQTGQQEFQPTK